MVLQAAFCHVVSEGGLEPYSYVAIVRSHVVQSLTSCDRTSH